MTSTNPYQIIDDDDEDDGFDWEAAAREIDAACQLTNPSTSIISESCDVAENSKIWGSKREKKPGASRQSTLDKFVGKEEKPKPQFEIGDNGEQHRDCVEGDETVSFVDIDAEAAKTWIYPVNVPRRDYQFSITKSALFSNTLVVLPTGLGKTLIAAVVMYNYFRWFPKGKIVFAAPSRPLVMQQIEACHNIVGIPQEWTIDMTGLLSPAKRACFWKTKRVFFVTPQVLEKDIQSGKCLVKYLVCLVIDEAHRATGNYSYCEAVRQLMAVPVQLRMLALTATPGSKQQTVQQVIDNLHISTLEYRCESDHDVISFVHNRKMELIQVTMGQDAVQINNNILEVIRPIVARLTALGVLQNRDYRTLSPCELLEIREKFRQAPPQGVSHVNNVDVEGYFGVLITLYYIHKLLSSHGIRPAYEMLERKLKEGFFAKFMSKNEVILKARLLMQQSLSHGAPSPKLSKMLEVLMQHFKTNDDRNSRVIIFSNYRESVKDILDLLANTGEPIRATQFIGQSSGKTLKGQSQKVQQAVLEKFRSGAYNVIVATSIGEEGLDIMEVGLVIFLACEGTELKGYMRKQAKGKAINKHMRNGGIKSFTFHPSPRMVPHIFKPETQFVKLSIEKFIPREKKAKDDSHRMPASKDKLTVAEMDLLAKYFHPNVENTWRASLIAYPHFQTFPSRVHKVNHSHRTTMLIDMMQRLHGVVSFSGDSKISSLQDDLCSGNSTPSDIFELDNDRKDDELHSRHICGSRTVSANCLELDSCHLGIQTDDCVDQTGQDNTVEALISPRKNYMKNDVLQSSEFCDLSKHREKTCEDNKTITESPIMNKRMSNKGDSVDETNNLAEITTSLLEVDACSSDMRDAELSPRLTNFITSGVVPESPIDDSGLSRKKFVIRDCISPIHCHAEQEANSTPGKNEKVIVVPESPNNENGLFVTQDCILPIHCHAEKQVKSLSPGKNEKAIADSGSDQNDAPFSPVDNETETPLLELKNCAIIRGRIFLSQNVQEGQTLVANPTNHSFSEESHLGCEDMSGSVKPVRKFKRLRKVDNTRSNRNRKSMKSSAPTADLVKSRRTSNPASYKHVQGKSKPTHDARVFIEEEAEVSETDVSDDEDDDGDDNSFDSFIDDRMNPTAASQPEARRVDMMAIYRRSLLSQTPAQAGLKFFASSPDQVTPMNKTGETLDSSSKTVRLLQTPQTEQTNLSNCKSLESVHINQNTSEAVPSSGGVCSYAGTKTEMTSRKRKLTFCHSNNFPSINLEQEFALQSNKELMDANATVDVLCDDQLYDGLDLDELEAQATLLIKQRLDSASQKQDTVPQPHSQNRNLVNSPSFDLGI
ncbi:hypothetical protein L6164_017253 [Bauhinia variegata]|uniref:Uncharacterized protein n=1 Tax=Bauhinia variegata TaxID=167791 RepID=A0ACB9N7J1_BAUVA|nr:hypothetical protein L6164_017253 [Bauhinia variegata]